MLDRKAIRMNILVNPSGKKRKWRAVDWVVEHNNLFTKVRLAVCLTILLLTSRTYSANIRREVLESHQGSYYQRITVNWCVQKHANPGGKYVRDDSEINEALWTKDGEDIQEVSRPFEAKQNK